MRFGFETGTYAVKVVIRLTLELLPALKSPEGHPRKTEYGNEGEPNVGPKPPSIFGFITSTKDFLRNRLFAWAELSFGESTFKLLITPVVHLLLSYVAGGAGRRRLRECRHDCTHSELAQHYFVPPKRFGATCCTTRKRAHCRNVPTL